MTPSSTPSSTVEFVLNGEQVTVSGDGSLLDVLRDQCGITSAKDGCAPQGQCGCCTVWVDGAPRVACVTPVKRVAQRSITTLEGIPDGDRSVWADALCATGGTQCGFCTPGIVMRLEALRHRGDLGEVDAVTRGLSAHLCRCTGWRTILEAAAVVAAPHDGADDRPVRDLAAAARRATLEGGAPQRVGPEIAAGQAGFADDTAPGGSLVAMLDQAGEPVVAASVAAAREIAGGVQGRHTTAAVIPPIELPEGDWALTLRTSWVEPAYLETDTAWTGGGDPLANGGAFGGKASSDVVEIASLLATEHGAPVRVRLRREDVVRRGPKRPPLAAGLRADGSGVIRVARTDGVAAAIRAVAPNLEVVEVDPPGPPTSTAIRGAGWVEAAILVAAAAGSTRITAPSGGWAEASIADDAIEVRVAAGEALDEIVLRSYVIGAAHQALGWVTSEGLAVDADGTIRDLTIRSFGIVRPAEMPEVRVEIVDPTGPPVACSDAAFGAVALAVWDHQGRPESWPTGRPLRTRAST